MRTSMNRIAVILAASTLAIIPLLGGCSDDSKSNDPTSAGEAITITLTANSIEGGKNSAGAKWTKEWLIPEFEKFEKAQGKNVKLVFEPQGVDDAKYKTKITLDLQSGKGADVLNIDGIWTGEFAQAGYVKPIGSLVSNYKDWDGWKQIPEAVQQALSFDGKRYGIPAGTDGRVIYYNKELFKKAGLPEQWQPKSWSDIIGAAEKLKTLGGEITPIQLNAGTSMGEATTMQGILPMLAGAGELIYQNGKWMGDTDALRDVLELYKEIYIDKGLGDPITQQEAKGRDLSFQRFGDGEIGMLLEGDYFWRAVINPDGGTAAIAQRDKIIGYAKIPALKPGKGVEGRDFVSMSGGSGIVMNPNTQHPDIAWDLMMFMNSPESYMSQNKTSVHITPRDDVNKELLKSRKMLSYVSTEILPITSYRPPLAAYPQVSAALQQATLDVVSGKSVDDALKAYTDTLKKIVGANNVAGK